MVNNLIKNNICNHINIKIILKTHIIPPLITDLPILNFFFLYIFPAKLHNVALYCYSGVHVELRGSSGKEK